MESESGERFPVTNPANGEMVAEVAQGGVADAQAALQAAHDAFSQWARLPARERAELMHRAAAIFRERLDDIADMLDQTGTSTQVNPASALRFMKGVPQPWFSVQTQNMVLPSGIRRVSAWPW